MSNETVTEIPERPSVRLRQELETHIMIDLETLDTRSTAVVIAIGIVAFALNGTIRGDFYCRLNIDDQLSSGRTVSGSTLSWWMTQSEEARRQNFSGETKKLIDGLRLCADFVRAVDPAGVWGNGANFDNAILASLFMSQSLPVPWAFYKDRCYRTVSSMYPSIKRAQGGTHHNALDDAHSQVVHLAMMLASPHLYTPIATKSVP